MGPFDRLRMSDGKGEWVTGEEERELGGFCLRVDSRLRGNKVLRSVGWLEGEEGTGVG